MTTDEAVETLRGWMEDTVTRPWELRAAVEALLADREGLREALRELVEAVAPLEGVEIPYPIAIPLGIKAMLARQVLAGKARP